VGRMAAQTRQQWPRKSAPSRRRCAR
jgi:hypothetical protein